MGLDSEVGAVAARRAGARKARPEGGHGRDPARRAGEARGFRRRFRSAWSLSLGEQGARCYTMARCTRQTRSEEHTSELQSLMRNSYAVLCLTKKKHKTRI